jgi:polyisoprenyl-phosphate glycosyltransferase
MDAVYSLLLAVPLSISNRKMMGHSVTRLAFMIPVYNDWRSLQMLVQRIDCHVSSPNLQLSVFVVDDCSMGQLPNASDFGDLPGINHLEILSLSANLGHQRAIAVGLCELERRGNFDGVVVMDGDGEDRPQEIAALIERFLGARDAITVGQRIKRTESLLFRSFYFVYKVTFRLLTGEVIDFGNFCIIPAIVLHRLTHMPEMWNHLAAAAIRSRTRICRVPTARGQRYSGSSSMNLESLIVHGLSAISVFTDVLFARLLAVSVLITLLDACFACAVIFVRLFTNLALPGWATSAVGLSAAILLQTLTFSAIAAFLMLATRSSFASMPANYAPNYIDKRLVIIERCHETHSHTSDRN